MYQVYILDIPVDLNKKGIPELPYDTEYFRNLFQKYDVIQKPDSVRIKIKINESGNPHAYAIVKIKTLEQAKKAIEDLNYTKLDGIPIRMYLNDPITRRIMQTKEGNLFIKNLNPEVEVSHLHEVFSQFGEIISCKVPFEIKMEPTKGDSTKFKKTILPIGYGYVQFRDKNDALNAMREMQGSTIFGPPIEIQQYDDQREPKEEKFTNCYIKNLPDNFTDDDLSDLFSQFGTVVSCIIAKDNEGKSQRFGFCAMKTHEEAVRAIENINGMLIDDKEIYCSRAMDKKKEEKN